MPPPASVRSGTAARTQRKAPVRFTSSVRRQPSRSISSTGAAGPATPALFTSTSSPPRLPRAVGEEPLHVGRLGDVGGRAADVWVRASGRPRARSGSTVAHEDTGAGRGEARRRPSRRCRSRPPSPAPACRVDAAPWPHGSSFVGHRPAGAGLGEDAGVERDDAPLGSTRSGLTSTSLTSGMGGGEPAEGRRRLGGGGHVERRPPASAVEQRRTPELRQHRRHRLGRRDRCQRGAPVGEQLGDTRRPARPGGAGRSVRRADSRR